MVRRWPTVGLAAGAPLAEVIRAWQGLGYNRRAVNLHRAAAHVAAHGWPDDLTELPGVGRYTADAVARFAFDADVLPVDTNVRRVLERTEASFGADSTDALMDLGATVCIARIPRCEGASAALSFTGRRYEPLGSRAATKRAFRQRARRDAA